MKTLTVVGRASKRSQFQAALSDRLSDPFRIAAIVPLSDDGEAKNFLAYVDPGDAEVEEETYDSIVDFLRDGLYDVELHESPQDAVEFVNENYQGEAYAAFMDPITSKEIMLRNTFMGLSSIGEITMMRGLFNKRPVAILVAAAVGHGPNDTVFTPLAILVDEELGNALEIPFQSSFDS